MVKFILSKSKVLEQFNKVKEFSNLISYSSKTNSIITRILEDETKCFFSIHLENELKNVKDKKRVIFLAQAWNQDRIKNLINLGIRFFIVDNESDLNELLKFLENNNVEIDLLLRIKYKENTIRTERYFVFGFNSDFVNDNLKKLKENDKITNLGIHFHRKTQNLSEWNLKYEISHIIDKENWKNIDYVNIGGGIPSYYANTNEKILDSIFEKIIGFRKFLNEKGIKMIIEPGRFIAAPSIKLQTKIIGVYDNNIIVDASVYNSNMDALIVPVKLLVENELDKGQGKPYVIKGITPCSMDLFRYRVYLDNPKKGDELIFLNAGAYNFRTDFCDLKEIQTEIVD